MGVDVGTDVGRELGGKDTKPTGEGACVKAASVCVAAARQASTALERQVEAIRFFAIDHRVAAKEIRV